MKNRSPEEELIKKEDYLRSILGEKGLWIYQQYQRQKLGARINPFSFRKIIPLSIIEKEQEEITCLKSKENFNQERARAELLEVLILRHLELSEWLGEKAMTVRTAEPDDFLRHVDLVVELEKEKEGEYTLLALDVTLNPEKIEKAVSRLKILLDKNQGLREVRYFFSPHQRKKIGPVRMPQVVLYFSEQNFNQLIDLEYDLLQGKAGSSQKLAETEIQLTILKEIIDQLAAQMIYLIERIYRKLPRVSSIFEKEMKKFFQDREEGKIDLAFTLKQLLLTLKQEKTKNKYLAQESLLSTLFSHYLPLLEQLSQVMVQKNKTLSFRPKERVEKISYLSQKLLLLS